MDTNQTPPQTSASEPAPETPAAEAAQTPSPGTETGGPGAEAATSGEGAAQPQEPAPTLPLAQPLANTRTQSRVSKPAAPRTGARKRKASTASHREPSTGELVCIVLLTSKITAPDGRAIARRTAVLAPDARAVDLIDRDQARFATDAETEAATITID